MSEAPREENRVPAKLGVSSVDGVTPLPFKINPVTEGLMIQIAVDTPVVAVPNLNNIIPRDDNRVTVAAGVSSVDGVTLLPFMINPSGGCLLIEPI